MDKFMTLRDYAKACPEKVSVTTLWNWHKRGLIKITVNKSPIWVIDSSKYPPSKMLITKRGKGSENYPKKGKRQ